MSHSYRGKMNSNASEFVPSSSSSGTGSAGGSGGPAGWKNPVSGNSRGGQGSQARPRKQEQRKQDRRGSRSHQVVPAYANDYQQEDGQLYQTANKRGQISLNHLLSFQMPPRQLPSANRSVRRKSSVYYEPYNKERFVNANFRFIMDDRGDYTVNVFDPDVVVNWKDIVQAIVPITKPAGCPICLSPPMAPKVTKCGHVYCWPCITHYLQLGENKWRKCPICYDAIYAKDLKSARFSLLQEVGKATTSKPAKVKMVLMKRAINSTIALPRAGYDTWAANGRERPPLVNNANAVPYAKLLLSTPEYLQTEILLREQDQLRQLLKEASAEEAVAKAMAGARLMESHAAMGSERPFIETALREVKENLEALQKSGRVGTGKGSVLEKSAPEVAQPAIWSEQKLLADAAKFQSKKQAEGGFETAFSDDEEPTITNAKAPSGPPLDTLLPRLEPVDSADHNSTAATSERKKKLSNPAQPPSDGLYYFYQSVDGQHLYLHPLDIKVLKFEYEQYSKMPNIIEVDVIKAQESTMNEDLRKRCRYLGHVPLSCDVTFCEVDHKNLVREDTRQAFDKELTQRSNRFKAAERKDKQEREQNGRIGKSMGFSDTDASASATLSSSWEADYAAQFPTTAAIMPPVSSSYSDTASHSSVSPPLRPTDNPSPVGSWSAAPTSSFARIAATSSSSGAVPWTRRPKPRGGAWGGNGGSEDDDEYDIEGFQGWTLDFEEAVMCDDRLATRGGGNAGIVGAGSGTATGGGGGAGGAGKGRAKKAKKVTLVTNGGNRGRQ
ncbi:hypothetical protein HKX48_003132 [Thoreauomyces humboldtii]|nr:hypothetical protein HKX48_003132 [Thoreauomyces humboldtii]